ncbi:MAG: cell division protein ZipA [Gammaproteobacteria bacterium]|nr:MAG: cell division protein ZipA [Gammaproteobacteria bacterium]
MTELRIALLVLGVILIAVLFFWYKKNHFLKSIFDKKSVDNSFRGLIDDKYAENLFVSDFEAATLPSEPISIGDDAFISEKDEEKFTISSKADNPQKIKQEEKKLPDSAVNIKENQKTVIRPAHKDKPNPFAKYLEEEGRPQKKIDKEVVNRVDAKKNDIAGERQRRVEKQQQKVVDKQVLSLVVKAKGELRFKGADIDRVMRENGLIFGGMNIYHKSYGVGGNAGFVFSLANLIEPGFFDRAKIDSFTTPGLVLFSQIPSELDANYIFDQMLISAKQIAMKLNGTVLDDKREPISRGWIDSKRRAISTLQSA